MEKFILHKRNIVDIDEEKYICTAYILGKQKSDWSFVTVKFKYENSCSPDQV